mmetsp:Transcript_2738/g.10750  ORF Transcript_2738/g.10750 Transcript_2738/m.10750 type:complete len:200 (-) Transcript_2738:149-748(-)
MRLSGMGMPKSPMRLDRSPCSRPRGKSLPLAFTDRATASSLPLMNSLRSRSRRKRVNSCASCCWLPAKEGTSVQTALNNRYGGKALYSPDHSVRRTARSSPPRLACSAAAILALLFLVSAGGRIGGTILGSSSPDSVFLRFRLLLNPGNDKISSAVMGALAAGDPRDRSAALRDVAASSLNMHSRNSRTWLRAWSTLFM